MDDTAHRDRQAADVDAEGARALMVEHGYAYVDVRDADEFEDGHPAGAVGITFSRDLPSDFVAAARARFAVDAKLVVGCNSGARSRLACGALRSGGFINVVENRTGWDGTRGTFGELREPGWRRLGFPTEHGPTRF